MTTQAMLTSRAAVVAGALAGAAGAVASIVVAAGRSNTVVLAEAVTPAVSMVYIAVAAVVCLAKPGHRVGVFALAGAVAQILGHAAVLLAERGLLDEPGSVPLPELLAAVGGAARGFGFGMLVVAVPLVFPDGQLYGSPRRRRWSARVAAGSLISGTLGNALTPEQSIARLAQLGRPVLLPAPFDVVSGALSLLGLVLGVIALLTAIVGLIGRWRGGDRLVRQQVLWFALAFAVPLLLFPVIVVSQAGWLFGVAILPVPVAIAVAMFQHRLYDVQLAVSRTLTWVGLSALVAMLYAVTVGGVGALLRDRGAAWLPWLAAGVVAVSFAPLRNGLQSGVNRVVYGRWSEAADVLAATGRRLADASNVPALVQTLADELGTGLGLRQVEIDDVDGRTLASFGVPGGSPESVPLTAYGELVGTLRWSGRTLRESDRRLMQDLARQLGGVVHSSQLVEELRLAQERLVLASEDERRRLRRDLHDGLGPALAALTLQVDTLRNVLAHGRTNLDPELLRLRSGIQSTVLDVRRIVEGLRPPALDELGLDGAVDELARRLADQTALAITVQASVSLPSLPAAVEVAAYRVAQEALTNVVRHSGASRCTVDLEVTRRELRMLVKDNGSGLVAARSGGVGLASMHERAAEIGGHLQLDAVPGTGTTVTLCLPLGAWPDRVLAS